MKAFVFAAALTASALAGFQVQAHAVLKTSNPAPSTVLRTAPTTLRLQFNEAVLAPFTSLAVTGPDQKPLHAGPISVDRSDKTLVTAPLHGAGAPGVYKVDWTAATGDMHKMKGSYTFTVRP